MDMTPRQAAVAFDEHLAERPAALEHLRAELAAAGMDADALLDGTPESLTPLWRWVAERILAIEDLDIPFVDGAPAPKEWPGWARYGGVKLVTPDVVVALLDGLVTYVEDVVLRGAPRARRAIVTHPVKRYHAQHYPGFAGATGALTLPACRMVSATAGGLRRLQQPLKDSTFTDYARNAIATLETEPEPRDDLPEPERLLEVMLDDGEFDVSLSEELAHEHSRAVDRMVKELRAQRGVRSAHREDREVLLVRAPDWTEAELERWLTEWLQRHVPAVAPIG